MISWFPGSAWGTAMGGSASSLSGTPQETESPIGQFQAEPGIEDAPYNFPLTNPQLLDQHRANLIRSTVD